MTMKKRIICLLGLLAGMLFLPASSAEAQQKPVVWVLATGGTLAGEGKAAMGSTYRPGVLSVDQILAGIPSLGKIAELRGEQFAQLGSQDMTEQIWLALAKRTQELLAREEVSGVVITHGTDTQEETAYFLHLTVRSPKPVVLTGAMHPSTDLGADGPRNLYNAVACAASPLAAGRGVMVLMDDQILSADDVTKVSTLGPGAFQNPSFGPLGRMLNGTPQFTRRSERRHTIRSEFDLSSIDSLPRVEVVSSYAGATSLFIRAAVQAGARGIVIAGVGNGNLSAEMLNAASSAHREEVAIVSS